MDPLEITCPKCDAPPHKRCRTLITNRVTDTHIARALARFNLHRITSAPNREPSS